MRVIVFAEGEFANTCEFSTEAEADAFAKGVALGGNLYGAGSCTAYVLPRDTDDLYDSEDPEEIRKALGQS